MNGEDLEIDELKLTAYALGELDGPDHAAQRGAVEAHLAADESARGQVRELRSTAQVLTESLAQEPDLGGLTALQRAVIERRLEGHDRPLERDGATSPIRLRRNWALWGSLAASVMIVCTVFAGVMPMLFRFGTGSGIGGGGTGTGTGGTQPPPGIGPLVILPEHPLTAPATGPGIAGIGEGGWDFSSGWPDVVTPFGDMPFPESLVAPYGLGECGYVRAAQYPLSTFPPVSSFPGPAGTGSLSAIRRALDAKRLPPPQTVRTDELINAFAGKYHPPRPGEPVGVTIHAAACPWKPGHALVRVGLRSADGPAASVVARDVRVEVEFNPAFVAGYRLIGYEDRPPRRYPDTAPPAEIPATRPGVPLAAGQTVTAVYEIVLAPESARTQPVEPALPGEPLRYLKSTITLTDSDEMMTVMVRYKSADQVERLRFPFPARAVAAYSAAPEDFQVTTMAAGLGLLLRDSRHTNGLTYDQLIAMGGQGTAGASQDRELLTDLTKRAKALR